MKTSPVLPLLVSLFFTSNAFTGLHAGFVVKQQRQQHRQRHVLSMGWGPDPVWSSGKVTINEAACTSKSCVAVTVEVPTETANEYKIPGQYVQFRLNEETKPLFLAISSAPGSSDSSFEFLIKKTENNDWICGASVDTTVELSQVLGGGFPIAKNFDDSTKDVLFFAAGSGIAPIRAAVESGQIGERSGKLYYGVQNPDELCFVSSFQDWKNIEVIPVMSQPPSEWEGRTGYVQKALEEDVENAINGKTSGVIMCGMKEMAEAVKEICTNNGVSENRILTNF